MFVEVIAVSVWESLHCISFTFSTRINFANMDAMFKTGIRKYLLKKQDEVYDWGVSVWLTINTSVWNLSESSKLC